MKLVMCGKGGCGKSTLSSLMGKELVRRNRRVLIVDGDESNFGLHKLVGLDVPKDFFTYFGTRKDIMDSINHEDDAEELFDRRWTRADIPSEYVLERNGISLMASGKIHEANEGCGCAAAKMLGKFMENLDLAADEDMILDMEAGIEHFGRGTDNSADAIIMVVDPSFESIELSEKVKSMADSIGKPVYFALNKMDAATAEVVASKLAGKPACIMPAEQEVMRAGLMGEEQNGSWEAIVDFIDKLLADLS